MKINEVEKLTGLTKKAIRLYESRGLLDVSRASNTYREYGEEHVKILKLIRLFRTAGISLFDIKLWREGVVTSAELAKKRKAEIENENIANLEQLKLCEELALLSDIGGSFDFSTPFDENDRQESAEITENSRLAVGIDIGTTTISAAVVDLDAKKTVQTFNLPGGAFIKTPLSSAKEQDAKEILQKSKKLLDSILDTYKGIRAIGVTGQMHGVIYCDKDGHAVSELATWQDGRADEIFEDGRSYCDEIFRLTGKRVSAGYGLATHFYNMKNSLVPKGATSVCTVMDYVIMALCGLDRPIMHTTNAHSFGLFDIEANGFDRESVRALGIDESLLPRVTADTAVVGEYRDIPVSVAIGDNQASVFGAVKDEESSALANYGTGSQISCVSSTPKSTAHMECRPYIGGKFLLCGSALAGGRAYAMLERFFRAYMAEATGEDKNRYEEVNRIAKRAFGKVKPLDICTKFSGERGAPDLRGSISGISEENFTPAAVTLGFLYGMARELCDMYAELEGEHRAKLVTSGNVARKNPVFTDVLADVFGMEVSLTAGKEEAASGAALFALLAANLAKNQSEVKACIVTP